MSHKLIQVRIILAAALVIAAGAGCTAKSPPNQVEAPREVLRHYLGELFEVKKPEDVERLLKFTSGNAHQDLLKLQGDKDLFQHTFIDQKIELNSALRIRDERKIDNDRYSITYELTYSDKTTAEKVETAPPVRSADPDHSGQVVNKEAGRDLVTAKKHAIFARNEASGEWLIDEVQNLKTFVEHTTEENISADAPEKK